MRAMLLAAIAAFGSACGADGVFIEVQRPPGMPGDRVQLLIADRGCQLDGVPCESMQPQSFGQPIFDAQVFFRDALDEHVADFEGDTATFQLEVKDKRLPLVLALSSRPGPQGREITGVAIMRGTIDLAAEPVRYEVLLEPPDNLQRGVVTWPSDAPELQCVGVRDSDGTHLFVVPAGDPDCDDPFLEQRGITECAPLAFLGLGVDPDTLCLAGDPMNGACMVGATTTCDESGNQRSCVARDTCLPSTVCASCESTDLACAVTELPESPVRVNCTMPAALDIANNVLTPCLGQPVVAEPFAALDCKSQPLFADPADLLGGVVNEHVVDTTARVKVTKFDPTCHVELDWEGTLPAPGPLSSDAVAHIEVLQPSSMALRHLLIPVTFKFEVGCGAVEPKCVIEGASANDTVFKCAQ